jgi:hypothetical protein
MGVLIEDIHSFVSDNTEEKDLILFGLLKDFYLLIVGANENEELKTSNFVLLERFLTSVLASYHHIELNRFSLLSIIKETLLMIELQDEVVNSSTINIEVNEGKLTLKPIESSSQNEVIFVLSQKDL